MDSRYGQLNYGVNVDLEIEAEEETKANGTDKLYKLKVAQSIKHIIFRCFILEVTSGLLFRLFLYLLSISKTSVKIII